jgi:hypothetical protein
MKFISEPLVDYWVIQVEVELTRGKGFTKSVRTLWVYSMHGCISYHISMTKITDLQHITSDQHEEMGVSCIKRDHADLLKLSSWVQLRNPFDTKRTHLQSLTSGVIANQSVNCDRAETIGSSIQASLNSKSIVDTNISRSSCNSCSAE